MIKWIKNKFKTVFCEECKHRTSKSDIFGCSFHCKKFPVYESKPIKSKNYVKKEKSKKYDKKNRKIENYINCEYLRKKSYCFFYKEGEHKGQIELVIAKEFTDSPGPRYAREGEFSGENFRELCLLPKLKKAIKEGKFLLVDLDGCFGYGNGFIEEAFRGILREYPDMNSVKVLETLIFKSEEEPYLIQNIKDSMEKEL